MYCSIANAHLVPHEIVDRITAIAAIIGVLVVTAGAAIDTSEERRNMIGCERIGAGAESHGQLVPHRKVSQGGRVVAGAAGVIESKAAASPPRDGVIFQIQIEIVRR